MGAGDLSSSVISVYEALDSNLGREDGEWQSNLITKEMWKTLAPMKKEQISMKKEWPENNNNNKKKAIRI